MNDAFARLVPLPSSVTHTSRRPRPSPSGTPDSASLGATCSRGVGSGSQARRSPLVPLHDCTKRRNVKHVACHEPDRLRQLGAGGVSNQRGDLMASPSLPRGLDDVSPERSSQANDQDPHQPPPLMPSPERYADSRSTWAPAARRRHGQRQTGGLPRGESSSRARAGFGAENSAPILSLLEHRQQRGRWISSLPATTQDEAEWPALGRRRGCRFG